MATDNNQPDKDPLSTTVDQQNQSTTAPPQINAVLDFGGEGFSLNWTATNTTSLVLNGVKVDLQGSTAFPEGLYTFVAFQASEAVLTKVYKVTDGALSQVGV